MKDVMLKHNPYTSEILTVWGHEELTPGDVEISQCSVKAEILSRVSQCTSGRQRLQVRHVIFPKTPAGQRWALTHPHLTWSSKFQAVFRPRKLLLSLVQLWWSVRQTENEWWIFVPVSTSSQDFPEAGRAALFFGSQVRLRQCGLSWAVIYWLELWAALPLLISVLWHAADLGCSK